jgi:hypothetical protein
VYAHIAEVTHQRSIDEMNRNFLSVIFLVLLPLALSGQGLQDVAPLTNWPAPLYFQPSVQQTQVAQFEGGNFADSISPENTSPANALVFVAMTPCRVVDTRPDQGFPDAFGAPNLAGGATRTFPIQSSACSIPSIAQAYSFNVTVVPFGFLGYITVWPTGQPRPLTSTLNDDTGLILANAAIVKAGTGGAVDVFAFSATDLIIDINGYYAPLSGLTLAQGTASTPSLSFANDPTTGIFSSGVGTLNVATAGTNRLTVGADGNVGIGGLPDPSMRLAVLANSPTWGIYATGSVGVVGSGQGGGGIGLYGSGSQGIGVEGTSSGGFAGVYGSNQNAPGVRAFSTGAGADAAALRVEKGSNGGVGIYSTTSGLDAVNVLLRNDGNGDLVNGFCAGCTTPAFRVRNDGSTFIPGLVVTPHGMKAESSHPGLTGTALWANNTDPHGISIFSTSTSDDANIVVNNAGAGDLIRGFCSGCASPAFRVTNSARTITRVLEITGGSDLAEHFDVAEEAQPGMIVAIDPKNAGRLTIARGAYNRRAAGVISGANDLNAGMVLPDPNGGQNSKAVTLTGRVWVYCDATKNPIQAGDLLTTSDIAGHAMKVTNYTKAQGAIIGKALTSLRSRRGLVLMLASLQ